MKFLDVRRIIRISAFVLGLALITVMPASAQTNANTNVNRIDRTDTTRVVERDDTDWGWLGLLGLLGLAGLIPKKRTVEVQEFRDTGANRTASGTGTTP